MKPEFEPSDEPAGILILGAMQNSSEEEAQYMWKI